MYVYIYIVDSNMYTTFPLLPLMGINKHVIIRYYYILKRYINLYKY